MHCTLIHTCNYLCDTLYQDFRSPSLSANLTRTSEEEPAYFEADAGLKRPISFMLCVDREPNPMQCRCPCPNKAPAVRLLFKSNS